MVGLMTARRSLSRAARAEILYAQEGRCAICGRNIHPYGNFQIDHAHALGLAGADDDDNLRAVHEDCHKKKTKRDVKDMGKQERLARARAAHDEAMARGKRRPNAKERAKAKMDARNRETLVSGERQD